MSRIRLTPASREVLDRLTYTCYRCDGNGTVWDSGESSSRRPRRRPCDACDCYGEIPLVEALLAWASYDDPAAIAQYALHMLAKEGYK